MQTKDALWLYTPIEASPVNSRRAQKARKARKKARQAQGARSAGLVEMNQGTSAVSEINYLTLRNNALEQLVWALQKEVSALDRGRGDKVLRWQERKIGACQ